MIKKPNKLHFFIYYFIVSRQTIPDGMEHLGRLVPLRYNFLVTLLTYTHTPSLLLLFALVIALWRSESRGKCLLTNSPESKLFKLAISSVW